jgi:hypothetical protein
MTPEERKKADREADEGGYNEASEAYNLGLTDRPPPRPAPATPKPKPKSPDRPYKPVSPDRPYKKMASGGYVSKADGCCSKGKTKGKFR